MPTRLIALSNVGGSDNVSLLEYSDPEPYASLSYCWGNNMQVTTTSTDHDDSQPATTQNRSTLPRTASNCERLDHGGFKIGYSLTVDRLLVHNSG